MDTGTFKASTTTVILYTVRLAARLENYISFLLSYDSGTHDSILGKPFRQLQLTTTAKEQLTRAHRELRKVMLGDLRPLLLGWYGKLSRELDRALVSDDTEVLDENIRHMCVLHSHMVLMLRNVTASELDEAIVTSLVCGIGFLATRHQWGKGLLDHEECGRPSYDAWRVPEPELYEALQVMRRKLITWLRETATQSQLDCVMTSVLRVSEGSGAMLAPPSEIPQRWGYLASEENRGRFAMYASRSRAPVKSGASEPPVPTMLREPDNAMVFDVQVMQLTLMASHPQALKHAVAENADVKVMFGEVAMQACLTDHSVHREVFKLVGRAHSIAYWDVEQKMPLLELWRAYFPAELFPSEKSWLPSVLEPVRLSYMMEPQPLQLFMPEAPLAEDAQVAYLVGKQPKQSGVWLEIFVYRARRMVHVYRLESHGRRHYRSLVYASDTRFCLHEMQPPIEAREAPWPTWARHQAGHPYIVPSPAPSAVITRESSVPENLSFGEETFLPPRLLYGLLPTILLEMYSFWQDESDCLRGYPKESISGTAHSQHVMYATTPAAGTHRQPAIDPSCLPPPLCSIRFHSHAPDYSSCMLAPLLHPSHTSPMNPNPPSLTPPGSFIKLGVGGHVALHGSRFDDIGRGDKLLTPARAVILRLRKMRLERQGKAVHDTLAIIEDFTKEHSLLTAPFESSFAVCGSVSKLLRRLGGHSFGEGTDAAISRSLTTVHSLLPQVSLVPFQRRRKRHRIPSVVVPALIDALTALVDADQDALAIPMSPRPDETNPRPVPVAATAAASASDLDDEELVLLDLLHAPPESYLHSLASVMARVDCLSHVLAWAKYNDSVTLGRAEAVTQSDLRIVTIPRLKLTFQALRVRDSVRLYSVDHADLFITNERNEETTAMLEGIPHSLLLSNSNDEMSVLVPVWSPIRPLIEAMPLSTVLARPASRIRCPV